MVQQKQRSSFGPQHFCRLSKDRAVCLRGLNHVDFQGKRVSGSREFSSFLKLVSQPDTFQRRREVLSKIFQQLNDFRCKSRIGKHKQASQITSEDEWKQSGTLNLFVRLCVAIIRGKQESALLFSKRNSRPLQQSVSDRHVNTRNLKFKSSKRKLSTGK